MSYTKKSWAATHRELTSTFRKWGVQQWDVQCTNWGQKAENWNQTPAAAAVYVKFAHPSGYEIHLKMDSESRAVDNFRQLYLGLEEMRMLWVRGLENMVRTAYLQLEAPGRAMRDPYEVLGVRPDAPLEVVEASYKALARSAHPDAGGSDEQMIELNAALERIKSDRSGELTP